MDVGEGWFALDTEATILLLFGDKATKLSDGHVKMLKLFWADTFNDLDAFTLATMINYLWSHCDRSNTTWLGFNQYNKDP